MNKKAALNLSIQAIVIVVIAFVVLGLGLGFVRGVFGDLTDTTVGIQEQIKQQVLDDLRTGNKKLSFPASEIKVGKKESKVTAIGVKNTKEGVMQYRIVIEALGGDAIFGDDIADNFLYATDVDELQPTDTRVIPIRITSETTSGTGQFKVRILDVTDDEAGVNYDSKSFFITVLG